MHMISHFSYSETVETLQWIRWNLILCFVCVCVQVFLLIFQGKNSCQNWDLNRGFWYFMLGMLLILHLSQNQDPGDNASLVQSHLYLQEDNAYYLYLLHKLYSTLKAMVRNQLLSSSSQTEMKDHPLSLWMMRGQHIKSLSCGDFLNQNYHQR